MSGTEKDPPEKADAEASPELDAGEVEAVEVPALSALLKRSLAVPEPEPTTGAAKDESDRDRALLVGVQKKLRQRSKGKFYADGWSTTHSRVNYALVAGVMLVVIVAVYWAMGPMGISLH